jgi:hypothetical protein
VVEYAAYGVDKGDVMLTREQLRFILTVTDFFHGHWEDPEWGRRINEALKKVNVYLAASEIEDKDMRVAIQGLVEKNMTKSIATLPPLHDPVPGRPRL